MSAQKPQICETVLLVTFSSSAFDREPLFPATIFRFLQKITRRTWITENWHYYDDVFRTKTKNTTICHFNRNHDDDRVTSRRSCRMCYYTYAYTLHRVSCNKKRNSFGRPTRITYDVIKRCVRVCLRDKHRNERTRCTLFWWSPPHVYCLWGVHKYT